MTSFKKIFINPSPINGGDVQKLNLDIDKCMSDILQMNIPQERKLALYNDALNRYQTKHDTLNQPMKIDISEQRNLFSASELDALRRLIKGEPSRIPIPSPSSQRSKVKTQHAKTKSGRTPKTPRRYGWEPY